MSLVASDQTGKCGGGDSGHVTDEVREAFVARAKAIDPVYTQGDLEPSWTKRLGSAAHPGKIHRPNVDPFETRGIPDNRLSVLQRQKVDDETGMNRVHVGGQDLGETAVVPPAVHLAERWRGLGHRQAV